MNLNVRRKTTRTLPTKFQQLKSRREQSRRVVRTVNPTQAHESRIYSDYASLYDKTFGKIFYNRIKHVIESLHIPPGAEVVELGVGTGTSFPAYPTNCKVMGIDLAKDMLAQARAKISKNSWSHLQVMEMDALNLTFADNSFDYVTVFHTVTVVPDPVQMLAEAQRVCKPGGKIVIVNHFTTDLPIIGSLTEALDPITRRLGWRTKLKLEPFLQATDLTVEEIYKLSKASLYTVIRGRVV
ncbi:MAG TPA: methyltransferase domain-containing protein [Candidatus Limnocylindrales bacterium]|nr:methyltransferase domain-containing protein [Candidatus Limnocylindrales bacterium]